MTRRLMQTSGIRNIALPRPIGQPLLPLVRLSERRWRGGRLWWPWLPQSCQTPHCGGRLLVRPADTDDGDVSCSFCSRAVARVGSEAW